MKLSRQFIIISKIEKINSKIWKFCTPLGNSAGGYEYPPEKFELVEPCSRCNLVVKSVPFSIKIGTPRV